MQYIPYFITHEKEFEIIGKKNDPNHKRIPRPNATKEGIQSLYRFEVECEDEPIVEDKRNLERGYFVELQEEKAKRRVQWQF